MTCSIFAQKKILNHSDFDIWNTIQGQTIAPNGKYVMYSLEKGEKDNHLKIKDNKANLVFEHERSERGEFTEDSNFAIFVIKAWKDSITEMKRRKVKKNKMPKDTIGIYNLQQNTLDKIAHIKTYKSPQKWSGFIAYTFDMDKKETPTKTEKDSISNDSTKTESKSKKKAKKASDKNGYPLVIRNLQTKLEDTIQFVTNYIFAKEGKMLSYITTGDEANVKPGVYVKDLTANSTTQVFESHDQTKYFELSFSDSGKNLGFVVDDDSTKAYVRPNKLYTWNVANNSAQLVIDAETAPKGYRVSPDGNLSFSKDETKLYFGLALPAIVQDTLLLDEEIVNVEVWTYDEPRLYTVQELQVKNDQKKSFQSVYHLNNKKLVQIATKEFPNASLADEGNGTFAMVSNSTPYMLESQWTGSRASDLAFVNVNTGAVKKALKKNLGFTQFSPKGNYVYGYNPADSTWFTYNIYTAKYTALTKDRVFYNELNDAPNYPGSYGSAGWTKDDKSIIIYDRYDIWEFNPENATSTRLTQGRENKMVYRYAKLDSDQRFIDTSKNWLLTTFNETSKNSGYYEYHYGNKTGNQLVDGPFRYSTPRKAKYSDTVLFTRQSFEEFPNLRISNLSFNNQMVLSDANPQQKDYNWGTAELVHWTSLDGLALTGMLIKPENFDPNKKYPMIVNFYEKSSDGLHSHKAPNPGRSTINYSFYASRGYVIFNPDVYYREGYPGESAFNCVIPGVTALIDKGFIDKDNIGTQGHSWGGYQIAYLVTKTNIFKAAESGAPVANMISAYGGIRWWTGLSSL
jgi:dipeptidyl aminopeptidase/acylaminoacyl peptidase